jgi:pimeloyl-ACP methyl ester carboxylesterase
MPKATVNGVELFYETEGAGQPVLLIHGGYGGAGSTLVPALRPEIFGFLPTERFWAIAYDRRNAGRSSYSDGRVTLNDLVEDAAALLDHLEVQRAIIVGSSAGGPIAMQFALTYPERVTGLALVHTAANLMNPGRERARGFNALMAKARADGDRAAFAVRKAALRNPPPLVGPYATNQASVERDRVLREVLAAVSDDELFRLSTGELRNIEAYQGVDLSSRLAELKMPVFITHGTADSLVPFAWGEALHDDIAGSEFAVIPEADHAVLQYEAGRAALRDWADRVAAHQPA